MLGSLVRVLACGVAAAMLAVCSAAARADGTQDVYARGIVSGANDSIKTLLDSQRAQQKVSQVPPVRQRRPEPKMELPGNRIEYRVDISAAYPYGNIGSYGRQGWLMGGMDASVGYGFNWSTRLVASMFQLQHWPYGFNSGLVPVYLAGFRNPVGCADLSGGTACGPGTGRNINVRTKDTFGVFMLQKMFVIRSDKLPGPIPIVITPTYVARGGQIGFAPHNNDVVPFTYNLPDGPVVNIPVRTAQYYAVAVTMPFLKTPKMFGTFTVAPQWLVHTAGANVGNSMQLPQVIYLEYTPFRDTTLFFEPQSARDYLPTDPYPEHLFAYFLGASQRLSKYTFVQVVLNSGNATNRGPDGVVGVKCLTVQQILSNACGLAIGGLKATQIQLQFGLGSPSVFPL
ncbi:MAG: hypothetical protein JO311_02445 [Candidatus Eremiobacteraeota bacterium]|nr:hypothetical protein [Candidatus Eremiobacteraeota bacterium]MBV9263897.1 hypothetical protein [Candidatus Eremiobacteraeota bacterium]